MTPNHRLRSSIAMLAVIGMVQGQAAMAQTAGVHGQPKSSNLTMSLATELALQPQLSSEAQLALIQQKVKYVFVLFQENRSYEHFFGTYPGTEGLYFPKNTPKPGISQPIVNTDGSAGSISPFLITSTVTAVNGATVPLYPADTDSVDHSHIGYVNDIDVDPTTGVTRNDRYALNAEGLTTNAAGQIVSLATGLPAPTNPTLLQKQRAELVVSHIDCDTIPFLWQYADRFAMFDNFHQTTLGPSTPNAIAMIAGQSGETQWALHQNQASSNTSDPAVVASGGEPVVADPPPYGGSNLDPTHPAVTFGNENAAKPTFNQTYATLPLSFMGPQITNIVKADQNPAVDLADVQNDISTIASKNLKQVQWGWYQQGFDMEPTDGNQPASHSGYITHHNGPQYFGYIADNTKEVLHLHGNGDFFTAIKARSLPQQGGVFYLRGGYNNNDFLVPVDKNPAVQKAFQGNDDHPGYSDAQISEALVADEVNAIAQSPYWKDSAIIITYDETDGLYDHGISHIRSSDPEGNPLAGGPRVPTIVISPYGKSHVIVDQYSEHSSVIKFIDRLFNLVPLADLPDEVQGRRIGKQTLGQNNLGPADDKVGGIGDLTIAFDNSRLLGMQPPLPASLAMIPPAQVTSLPHYSGLGCKTVGVTPTDYVNGTLTDPPPADFNPRPGTTPGTPTSGTWTP